MTRITLSVSTHVTSVGGVDGGGFDVLAKPPQPPPTPPTLHSPRPLTSTKTSKDSHYLTFNIGLYIGRPGIRRGIEQQ